MFNLKPGCHFTLKLPVGRYLQRGEDRYEQMRYLMEIYSKVFLLARRLVDAGYCVAVYLARGLTVLVHKFLPR